MLNPFVVSRANAGRPPLKSYLHDLINTSQTTNSNTEAQIAATEGARLKKIIARQTKIVDALATEAKLFDTLYNLRVTYFKDKQQISDSNNLASVFETEVHWYKLVDAAKRKLDTASARLGGLVSRGRFLEHMDTVNRGGDVPEEDRTCAICFEPFSKGILPSAYPLHNTLLRLPIADGPPPATSPPCRVLAYALHRLLPPAVRQILAPHGLPDLPRAECVLSLSRWRSRLRAVLTLSFVPVASRRQSTRPRSTASSSPSTTPRRPPTTRPPGATAPAPRRARARARRPRARSTACATSTCCPSRTGARSRRRSSRAPGAPRSTTSSSTCSTVRLLSRPL